MRGEYLHSKFIAEIRTLPGFPELKILDLSCGDGGVSSEMAKCGCDCTGTRYRSDDYIHEGNKLHPAVKIVNGVDLSAELPFEARSFDVVLLKEVIEHLPNHDKIVREIGRVVKPGGTVILSTPNIHRLHSRLHFLLAGAHKLKRHRVGWELSPVDLYAYHYNPVDFPILHTLLYQSGLRVKRLVVTKIKLKYLLLGFLYPFVLWASFFEYRAGGRRASASVEGEKDLRRWMCHPAMLFSEQLLIVTSAQGAE